MSAQSGYYRHPTIHGDTIAFVSEDDLWRVGAEGGVAHRLTANPGAESFPALSPNGELLAFTSRDEGHPEAHLMDTEGGPPRRITYFGSNSNVAGWLPNSSAVVVASDWQRPFAMDQHLYAVPVGGGEPRQLPFGPARAVSWEPGGAGVVIGRNSRDPARWKRYRGGTVGTLWVDRKGEGDFAPLVRLAGNLANPMWIGNRIFFLSDHEGSGNLYSCTPTGRNLRRHTDHEDFYARFPSTDGHRIVYHAGADLWLFDVATGHSRQLVVLTPSARPWRSRRFMAPGKYLESLDLHPGGHSVALVVRGGAYSMPLWEGAPVRHGAVSAVRHRLATWLPDGERLVAVTDAEGEETLVVWRADGAAAPVMVHADVGRPTELAVAPAGRDRVALTNQRQEVLVVDLRTKRVKQIASSSHERIQGVSWSPDGRWLAFASYTAPRRSAIFLHDTETGRTREVTRPDFVDVHPSFDPEGRYLYFLSWRVFDPVYDGHFHDYGFPRGARPHLVTLQRADPSPFSVTHRAPRPPGSPPTPSNGKGEAKPNSAAENGGKEAEPPPVVIDFDGIEDRVVAFPVAEGRYGRVTGARGRALFSSYPLEGALGPAFRIGPPDPNGKLEAWDFATEKVEPLMEGIADFTVSMDGKTVGVLAGQKVRVVAAGFKEGDKREDKPGRETGWLDLTRVRVEVEPGAEWRQMFREAWRLQRDQFWTPDMAGIDWVTVHDRYLPLVDRIGCRSEFSDLLWEMQGELGTSHAYELGGDYRPEPGWFQGFLGADLERTSAGNWRVRRIPRGDSWDDAALSPLAAPGVGVGVGDRLVAIEAVELDGRVTPYERLVDRAGRPVQLTVRSGRRKPRIVPVTTLRSELALRYRDWVEHNRETVHQATGDRVGYLHIPDMGARGFAEFHRYFRAEVDHDGLVIDVRNNGGGNVSGLLLQKLMRRRVAYTVTRWGQPDPYPDDAPFGPMVALTNEHAGSDGDIFCHAFKLYGLGPLIGVRTWGGVVGIWPRHPLVDGTVTTQPEFAFWFEDVGWSVENYGTEPDIEVEIAPQDHAAGRDPQLDRAVHEVVRILDDWGPAPEFAPPPLRAAPRLPMVEPVPEEG